MTRRWLLKRRMRIWVLRIDGLRLRLAYYMLPKRFRSSSVQVWVTQMQRETAAMEASVRELNELAEELRG